MKLIELKEKILRIFKEVGGEEMEEIETTATYTNNIIGCTGTINIYNGCIITRKGNNNETK